MTTHPGPQTVIISSPLVAQVLLRPVSYRQFTASSHLVLSIRFVSCFGSFGLTQRVIHSRFTDVQNQVVQIFEKFKNGIHAQCIRINSSSGTNPELQFLVAGLISILNLEPIPAVIRFIIQWQLMIFPPKKVINVNYN